jgi:hypothetical protein
MTTLPDLGKGRSFAVLCSNFACQPPIFEAQELELALKSASTYKKRGGLSHQT